MKAKIVPTVDILPAGDESEDTSGDVSDDEDESTTVLNSERRAEQQTKRMLGSFVLNGDEAKAPAMRKIAFARLADETGCIETKKLYAALIGCGQECTRAKAHALAIEHDNNGDGQIDFEEFEEIVEANLQLNSVVLDEALAAIQEAHGGFVGMLSGYVALLKFFVFLLLFIVVVLLQNEDSATAANIGTTVSLHLFDDNAFLNADGSVSTTFATASNIYDWFDQFVGNTFPPPVCGDGRCEAPEEFTSWFPYIQDEAGGSVNAERFDPCLSDCGWLTDYNPVRINFDDTAKLSAAFANWEAVKQYGYLNSDTQTLGIASNQPVAGWNICSRDHKEYGHFRNVCIFDGDVFIEDLPYRTAELDPTNDLYRQSFDLDLFPGNWELRIAFDQWDLFHYTDQSRGIDQTIQFAYPAVRGSLQFALEGSVQDGTAAEWTTKEIWAPCPEADQCTSQWLQSMYLQDCQEIDESTGLGTGSVPPWYTEDPMVCTLRWEYQGYDYDYETCDFCNGVPYRTDYGPFGAGSTPIGTLLSNLFNTNGFKYNGSLGYYLPPYSESSYVTSGYSEFGIEGYDALFAGDAYNAQNLGDAFCDPMLNNVFARWDTGDCCESTCRDPAASPGLCAEVAAGKVDGVSFDDCTGPAAVLETVSQCVSNGDCPATCFGSNCDDWHEYFDCASLETYGCDCAGCSSNCLNTTCGALTEEYECSAVSECTWEDKVGWDYCWKGGSYTNGFALPCTLQELLDGTGQLKMPFHAWRAVRDIITHYEGAGNFHMWRVPTTLCPDCPAYSGKYLSVPFSANLTRDGWLTGWNNATQTIGTTTTETDPAMFPGLEMPRARYIGSNLVVLGGLLTTTRRQEKQCDSGSDAFLDYLNQIDKTCPNREGDKSSNSPFGSDPTLDNANELLFRQENFGA